MSDNINVEVRRKNPSIPPKNLRQLTKQVAEIEGTIDDINESVEEAEQDVNEIKTAINNSDDFVIRDNKMKRKNKAYNPAQYSGLGEIYLEKNNTFLGREFDEFVVNVNVPDPTAIAETFDGLVYDRHRKEFLVYELVDGERVYYAEWIKFDKWESTDDYVPEAGYDFICEADDKAYRWTEETTPDLIETEAHYGNVLKQEMVNFSNTIYHIQYDYTLIGKEITIPEGCVLQFDGGSLNDGKIVGNKTAIKNQSQNEPFISIVKSGTWLADNPVNRAYIAGSQMGMGVIYLKENFINGVNTLTQNMLNQDNTKYVIKYDFVLDPDSVGGTITVPQDCVLEFDGGSLANSQGSSISITGQNTCIQAKLTKIFNNIILSGIWNIERFYSAWIENESSTIINTIRNCCEIGINFRFTKGLYNFTNKIILYNNIIIDGENGNILTFNITTETYSAALQCGVSGKPWTGKLLGLNIYIKSGNYEYVIAHPNAYNCSVEDCYIDIQSHNITKVSKIISVNNNVNFSQLDYNKENIKIINNTIICDDENHYHKNNSPLVKPECIGVGDAASNITIANNTIYRTIDDLGAHMIKNLTIKNNRIFDGAGGRIYCSDSEDVLIDNNYLESESSMGIMVTLECNYRIPHNIIITNNDIKITGIAYYGIRINSGNDIIIRNNKVNGSLQVNNDYIIENDTHTINPTIDEATPSNIIIEGNILTGSLNIVPSTDKKYIIKSNISNLFACLNGFGIVNNNIINGDLSTFIALKNAADGFIETEIDLSEQPVNQWKVITDKYGRNIFDINIGKYIAYMYECRLINASVSYISGLFVKPNQHGGGQKDAIITNGEFYFENDKGFFVVSSDLPSFKFLRSDANETGTIVVRIYYIKQ